MSNFLKKNQNLLIVAAILIFGYWAITSGQITLPNINFQLPQNIVNVNNSLQQPSNTNNSSTTNQSDLRLIAAPYFAVSNIDTYCTLMGGAWHYENNFVGCVGVGSADCSQAIIQAALTQCIGTGAQWTCNANNIYCRYA